MLRLRPYKACDAHSIVSWTGDERAFRQWSADRFDRFPITGEDLDRYYRFFDGSDSFFEMTAFDETGPAGHMIMRFTDEKKSVIRFGFISWTNAGADRAWAGRCWSWPSGTLLRS